MAENRAQEPGPLPQPAEIGTATPEQQERVRQLVQDTDGIIEVTFRAAIRLFAEDLTEAGRDLDQAVQNVIGGTGAKLVGIDGAEAVER